MKQITFDELFDKPSGTEFFAWPKDTVGIPNFNYITEGTPIFYYVSEGSITDSKGVRKIFASSKRMIGGTYWASRIFDEKQKLLYFLHEEENANGC